MKKSIKVLAMFIVATMLCSMLSVATFAAGEELEVNAYYTGAEYTSNTVVIDGVITPEDGYVALTPNGVPNTLVNETLELERWGGDVPTAFTVADAKAEHVALGLTAENIVVKYYVAQDDDNIYLAVVQSMPDVTYEVDGVTYSTSKYIFNNLRLGFNGADPSQQIDFVSDGFWAAAGGEGTKWGVTYNGWIEHPFIVTGLADGESFTSKNGPASDIIAEYVDELGAPKDSRMEAVKADGIITRTYEMKLNKAAIAAEYAEVFGVENLGFDGMWIAISSTDYEWANDDDNYSLLWVNGTVVDSEVYGISLLPDVVYFGADPDAEEPEVTEPEVTEPEVTEPEVTEPEVTEPEVTEPEVTEPATTEPATTEPATTEPATTEPATTEAEVTTDAEDEDEDEDKETKKPESTKAPETTEKAEEKGGCGSSVSVAGIALVAALGTCTVFVTKKKED